MAVTGFNNSSSIWQEHRDETSVRQEANERSEVLRKAAQRNGRNVNWESGAF